MFFRRYKSVISKVILMMMIFASLAPAISHALASVTGDKSFTQKICTTNGAKLVLQVKTSLGQQLTTELTIKPGLKNQADSQTVTNHFEHCPFCLNHFAQAVPNTANTDLAFIESGKFFLQAHYLAPVLAALHQSDHPSRAPPFLI